jgi:hypothetical protein
MTKQHTSKNLLAGLLLTAGCVSATVVQAALEDRGGGLIYDTDLKIEWLADANYADTSDYNTDGRMNWHAANTWAANLNYGRFDDWRLPTTNEMNHLFYLELDGSNGTPIGTIHNNTNYNLFTNIQATQFSSDGYYWSSSSVDANNALTFAFKNGSESAQDKTIGYYGWAVHPSVVPEPEAYVMLLAGLGLVGLVARRRKLIS